MKNKYVKLYEDFENEKFGHLIDRLFNSYDEGWVRRVIKKVREASVEKYDLETALKEWEYKGERDVVVNTECGICGQKPINYLFKIVNRLNQNQLWVGCDCIQKFAHDETQAISIYDDNGNRLTNMEAIIQLIREHYKGLVTDGSIRYAMDFIESVQDKMRKTGADDEEKESNYRYLSSIYRQYAELNYLTPNQIVFLDSLINKYKIDPGKIYKSKLNVNIKDPALLDDLSKMDDYNFNILKKYLDKHDLERANFRRQKALDLEKRINDPDYFHTKGVRITDIDDEEYN